MITSIHRNLFWRSPVIQPDRSIRTDMSKREQLFDYSIITEKSIRPDGSREDDRLDSEPDWLGEATSRDRPMGVEERMAYIRAMSIAFLSQKKRTLDASLNPMEVWTVRGVSEETRRRSKVAALMMSLPIGEFVDKALRAAVEQYVEVLRHRATATPMGKEGKIWTIRGVAPETRRRSRIAALQLGWTVGKFVDRALLEATDWLQKEGFSWLK